ncbi:flagellar hook-associated protein FlgL [Pseudomonas sp. MAP12]|uniref:Flagellar hook-associated protein FlgL n=1 Tax=Geopseudomonas aromaticivorans TaxID=2849492 RepID=A0ABS6MTW8_9GAMM|nr:flagellar hook-associated protein FlgL [Pseudomonas aromaticivorans]MBV2132256.1 flagellar hook-associated protein FlgL [Pseudomonas aromaticivorans]
MRISTITMYEQSLNSLNRQQGEFLKIGQHISSGRRVVNPSDDPQAAALAVGIDQAKAVDQQYANARVSARNSLSQEESVLNSTSDFIVRARTLLVQAGNDTLGDVDRQAIGLELQGIYEGLLGQANSADGNGRFMFGGFQDDTPPFVQGADGKVSYVGDSGVKGQQVDSARLMPSVDNGQAIFKSADDADLFATLENLIGTLATPVASEADKANLQSVLATAGKALGKSFDNVLAVRASVGARLNELDVLDVVGGNRMLNYEQVLSDRLDLDYNKAISDYTLRQVGLQAAQKAFVDVQKLSLFNQL